MNFTTAVPAQTIFTNNTNAIPQTQHEKLQQTQQVNNNLLSQHFQTLTATFMAMSLPWNRELLHAMAITFAKNHHASQQIRHPFFNSLSVTELQPASAKPAEEAAFVLTTSLKSQGKSWALLSQYRQQLVDYGSTTIAIAQDILEDTLPDMADRWQNLSPKDLLPFPYRFNLENIFTGIAQKMRVHPVIACMKVDVTPPATLNLEPEPTISQVEARYLADIIWPGLHNRDFVTHTDMPAFKESTKREDNPTLLNLVEREALSRNLHDVLGRSTSPISLNDIDLNGLENFIAEHIHHIALRQALTLFVSIPIAFQAPSSTNAELSISAPTLAFIQQKLQEIAKKIDRFKLISAHKMTHEAFSGTQEKQAILDGMQRGFDRIGRPQEAKKFLALIKRHEIVLRWVTNELNQHVIRILDAMFNSSMDVPMSRYVNTLIERHQITSLMLDALHKPTSQQQRIERCQQFESLLQLVYFHEMSRPAATDQPYPLNHFIKHLAEHLPAFKFCKHLHILLSNLIHYRSNPFKSPNPSLIYKIAEPITWLFCTTPPSIQATMLSQLEVLLLGSPARLPQAHEREQLATTPMGSGKLRESTGCKQLCMTPLSVRIEKSWTDRFNQSPSALNEEAISAIYHATISWVMDDLEEQLVTMPTGLYEAIMNAIVDIANLVTAQKPNLGYQHLNNIHGNDFFEQDLRAMYDYCGIDYQSHDPFEDNIKLLHTKHHESLYSQAFSGVRHWLSDNANFLTLNPYVITEVLLGKIECMQRRLDSPSLRTAMHGVTLAVLHKTLLCINTFVNAKRAILRTQINDQASTPTKHKATL